MPAAAHSAQEPQSAGAVLMVRPAGFGFNPQTAASNAFQLSEHIPGEAETRSLVLSEFEGLAEALQRAGVAVMIAPDSPLPAKPDAIFPNNWVSFHFDGTVVLYPMLAPNRRAERREDLVRQVTREGGYRAVRTVDL